MPLRVFKDGDGQDWRVWLVIPAASVTLDATFRDGWLCFERVDGRDRRRLSLAEAPDTWDTLTDDRLDELRGAAEPAQGLTAERSAAQPKRAT